MVLNEVGKARLKAMMSWAATVDGSVSVSLGLNGLSTGLGLMEGGQGLLGLRDGIGCLLECGGFLGIVPLMYWLTGSLNQSAFMVFL